MLWQQAKNSFADLIYMDLLKLSSRLRNGVEFTASVARDRNKWWLLVHDGRETTKTFADSQYGDNHVQSREAMIRYFFTLANYADQAIALAGVRAAQGPQGQQGSRQTGQPGQEQLMSRMVGMHYAENMPTNSRYQGSNNPRDRKLDPTDFMPVPPGPQAPLSPHPTLEQLQGPGNGKKSSNTVDLESLQRERETAIPASPRPSDQHLSEAAMNAVTDSFFSELGTMSGASDGEKKGGFANSFDSE